MTVLSVYRPHRVSFRQFLNDLVTFIDKYEPTLVISDFNIDVQNNLFPQFEMDLKSRNLFLMNTKSTYRLGSTLDYAFSKDPTVYFRQFSVPFSDHDVIQVAFFKNRVTSLEFMFRCSSSFIYLTFVKIFK